MDTRSLILALVAYGSASVAIAEEKSPYFIDGVHCEGLHALNVDALKRSWSNDNAAKIGPRVLDQQRCETVFSSVGIEKFEWMTPQDLELAQYRLSTAPYFRKAELSLKKSELRNHVHIYAKFEPRADHHFSIEERFKQATGNGKEGKRIDNDLSFEWNNRGSEPFMTTTLGVRSLRSFADHQKDLTDSRFEKTKLNAVENAGLEDRNFKLDELYASFSGLASHGFETKTDFHFMNEEHTASRSDHSASWLQMSALYNTDQTGLIGKMRLGPSVIGLQRESDEDPVTKKSKTEYASFAGVVADQSLGQEGRFGSSHITGDYFQGMGKVKDSYFYDIDLLLALGTTSGIGHGLGVEWAGVKNAVMPQHRFFMPTYNRSAIFYRASTAFGQGLRHELALDLGFGSLDNGESGETAYRAGETYAGVSYKYRSEELDLGLSLVAASGRTH